MQTCYPATAAVRTTEPTLLQEPITIQEARRQCGLGDNDYHDPELTYLIPAARQQVEHDAELTCYTGSHTWKFTDWPENKDWFSLPTRPVTAVASITYVATDGDTDTWSGDEWDLDTDSVIPVIKLLHGEVWPSLRGDMNGITVTFTAGYSTVIAVPQKVKWAVLLALHVAWLLKMNQQVEAERQQIGYERQIELIRRTVYV